MDWLHFLAAWVFTAAVLLILTSGKRTLGWTVSVIVLSAILAVLMT